MINHFVTVDRRCGEGVRTRYIGAGTERTGLGSKCITLKNTWNVPGLSPHTNLACNSTTTTLIGIENGDLDPD